MALAVAAVLAARCPCKLDVLSDIAEYLVAVVEESGGALGAEDLAALLEAQLDGAEIPTAGLNCNDLASVIITTLSSKKSGPTSSNPKQLAPPTLLKQSVTVGVISASSTEPFKPVNSIIPSASPSVSATAKPKTGGTSKTKAVVAAGLSDTAEVDDWGSAWADVVESGEKWGGRGFGGRGMGRITQLNAGKDVVLEGVTLAFGAGADLLTRSSIRLIHGHKYALMGANGVGKTTLLRKMAACAIPGFPRHLKVYYCDQEFAPDASPDTTAMSFLAAAVTAVGDASTATALPVELAVESATGGACDDPTTVREALLTDIAALEAALEDDHDDDELDAILSRLTLLDNRLQGMDVSEAQRANLEASTIDSDEETASVTTDGASEADVAAAVAGKAARTQAKRLLTLLGFDKQTRHCPLSLLSGGWRARLGIALGLVARPDILLLDEPTNHLDLHGVLWLEHFLSGSSLKEFGVETLVIVSHDRSFLDAVVTDVMMFKEQKLTVFPGSVSEYMQRMAEKDDHMARLYDAKLKQEKRYQAFIASAQSSTSKKPGKAKFVDPKKQKAAKEKKNKLSRLGWHRSDGKAFATRSLKVLDEDYLRLPEEVVAARKAKPIHFKFPSPDDVASALRSITDPYSPVIRLTNAAVGYGRDTSTAVLSRLTLEVSLKSRISLVGKNGCGKSTLLKLFLGQLPPLTGPDSFWAHQHLRIAFVPQHHTDVLDEHAASTPVQYLMETFRISQEMKARAHLGAFGLTGSVQLQPIGSLSGGQKARLSFACVTWNHPHVIIMDEPTNHLDLESIDALAVGLRSFEGAVVLVSHNASFMQSVCNELWVVESGSVVANKQARSAMVGESDSEDEREDEGFAMFFDGYRRSVMKAIRTTGRA